MLPAVCRESHCRTTAGVYQPGAVPGTSLFPRCRLFTSKYPHMTMLHLHKLAWTKSSEYQIFSSAVYRISSSAVYKIISILDNQCAVSPAQHSAESRLSPAVHALDDSGCHHVQCCANNRLVLYPNHRSMGWSTCCSRKGGKALLGCPWSSTV